MKIDFLKINVLIIALGLIYSLSATVKGNWKSMKGTGTHHLLENDIDIIITLYISVQQLAI